MIKKFNAVEYLVDKYVEGEYAIIPISLDDKKDFFNKHDPTQTTLAPEISEYIDKCSYNIPVKFKIKLEIFCEEVDEETKEKMRNAVRNHYGLIVFDKNIDLRANTYKTVWLLLLGIVFLIFVVMVDSGQDSIKIIENGESILREVLLVTGWFFVWQAVENFVSNRKNLRTEKKNNRQMFNSELIFTKEMSTVE